MFEISFPGLIGAAVGAVIGTLDFALIALIVRKAIARIVGSDPASAPAPERIEWVMKGVFAVNLLVFAGLGYWFGATIGG